MNFKKEQPQRLEQPQGLLTDFDHLNNSKLSELYSQILEEIGEDPNRQGLIKTPGRTARALKFMTHGYDLSVEEVVKDAIFDVEYDEMVLVKDIEFYSLCEHHILPFFGKCHVAYIPIDKIIGLSKIPRIVDMFSRRLQVQERLTTQIANALQDILEPLGVAVVMEAQHLCMMIRGVQKQNAKAVTSSLLGVFRDKPETRAEFMSLLGITD